MAGKRKPYTLFTSGCPHYASLVQFCGLVGKPFGVNLPVPTVLGEDNAARLSFVKNFCGGLLDCPTSHVWYRSIERLPRSTRMSIAMSLFLFRKVLPSTSVDLRSYAEKMSKESPPADAGFLKYIRRRVPELFPLGWDLTRYPLACLGDVVPIKSCLQRNLSKGGSRLEVQSRYGCDAHHTWVMQTLARESRIELLPSRVISVETGGKERIVSVPDVEMNLFRPLHTAIYNHMSRFPWLLRGDAKASRFSEFTVQPGEVFVSGDYESATDNLNSHVQREILESIIGQTVSVPKGIRESAVDTLSLRLEVEGTEYRQRTGQLMGNLLSFPLLCLVNYLAFRYFSGSRGPVRINGDDIVFRSTPEQADRWMKGVKNSGLVLSRGKTMVDGRYFSLNSSLFLARVNKVCLVPMVRSTAFGFRKDCGGVETLRGRFFSSFPGFFGSRRSDLRVEWLKKNAKWIVASGRSVTRGLGLPVGYPELVRSGLWEREAWHLSLSKEEPLPIKRCVLDQQRKPHGWELREVSVVTKEMKDVQREAGPEFVLCAWSNASLVDDGDYRSRVSLGTPNWEGWKAGRISLNRKARLLGLSVRNVVRYLAPRRNLLDRLPSRRKRVWLPEGKYRSIFPVLTVSLSE